MNSRRGQSTVYGRTRQPDFSKTFANPTYRDNPDEHDKPVGSGGGGRSADTDDIPDFNVTFLPLNDLAKQLPDVIEKIKADLESQNAVRLRKQEETIRKLEKQRNKDNEQQRYQTTTGASFESENKRLKNKLDEVQVEYTKLEVDYKDYISRAEECVKKAENDINKLKSEQKSQEGTLQVLRQQVRDAEDAKQNALTRLSKQMGHQLTDGNPDITDLSDTNRPTKLGERFAEVYDNQWTEALEVLQGSGYSDRDCVQKLLEILKNSNKYVCRAAENKLEELKKVLGISGMKLESDPTSQDKEVMSILKNLRKQMTAHILPDLVKACLRRIVTHSDKAVVAYAKECFELCWYMAVCDPPIHLEFNGTDTFDKNLFRHFTSTGNELDYVVWPVVYLHKGGPVVSKGVAQPYPSTERHAERKTPRNAWETNSDNPPVSSQYQDRSRPTVDLNQQRFGYQDERSSVPPVSSSSSGGGRDPDKQWLSRQLTTMTPSTTGGYEQSVTKTQMNDQQAVPGVGTATVKSVYSKKPSTQAFDIRGDTWKVPHYIDEYKFQVPLTDKDFDTFFRYRNAEMEGTARTILGEAKYWACADYFHRMQGESNA